MFWNLGNIWIIDENRMISFYSFVIDGIPQILQFFVIDNEEFEGFIDYDFLKINYGGFRILMYLYRFYNF